MIITGLWSQQPGKFFCISTKSSTGKWKDNFFKRRDLRRVQRFIDDNLDKDIYFCPHGFTRAERKKEYACLPTMLWADMDECDPRKLKKYRPTIAIESSPGRFVGLWLCDDTMDEELNRRLTYEIEADRGGWDLTQVLRVPRTTNYKYPSLPKVRVMWDDGPTYSTDTLDDELPQVKEKKKAAGTLHAPDVWRQYEKAIPAWARRQVFNGKPRAGDDRSTMLWRLEHAMLDAGMSEDEAFVVIKASPWNKFAGRRNEDEQLRRELDKVIEERLDADLPAEPRTFKLLQTSLADVEERDISWLWYPYLARGEVTLLDGDPGSKKSWLAQIISKAICDGGKLPGERTKRIKKGRVAYFDLENEASTVTKKRMRWAGLQNYANFIQESEGFSIQDPEMVEHMFDELERLRPEMVVFDTMNQYIGTEVDIYRSNEATQAFRVFIMIARRFNCSVVVVRHLNKGGGGQKAMHRGLGSVSFVGTARVQLIVGRDPEDRDTGVLTMGKTNLSKEADALTFYTESQPSLKDPDKAVLEWGEFVNLSSDDVVGVSKRSTERDDANDFLREALEDGPVELRKLETMAEKRSISRRTLQRAANALNVTREVSGFGKERQAIWSL